MDKPRFTSVPSEVYFVYVTPTVEQVLQLYTDFEITASNHHDNHICRIINLSLMVEPSLICFRYVQHHNSIN